MSVSAVFQAIRANSEILKKNFNSLKEKKLKNKENVSKKSNEKVEYRDFDIENKISSIPIEDEIKEISKEKGVLVDVFG